MSTVPPLYEISSLLSPWCLDFHGQCLYSLLDIYTYKSADFLMNFYSCLEQKGSTGLKETRLDSVSH